VKDNAGIVMVFLTVFLFIFRGELDFLVEQAIGDCLASAGNGETP
jgi:hypothetical protein